MEKKGYKNYNYNKYEDNKKHPEEFINDYNRVNIETIVHLFQILKKMAKGWECEKNIKQIISLIVTRKVAMIYGQDILDIVEHAQTVIIHYTLHESIITSEKYKPMNGLIKTICDFLHIKLIADWKKPIFKVEQPQIPNDDPFGQHPLLEVTGTTPKEELPVTYERRDKRYRRGQRRRNQVAAHQSYTYNQPSVPSQSIPVPVRQEAASNMYPVLVNPINDLPVPMVPMSSFQPRIRPSNEKVEVIDAKIKSLEDSVQQLKDSRDSFLKNFTCPLSKKRFVAPIRLVEDGKVYELFYIKQYIQSHLSSPITNQYISNGTFQKPHDIIDLMGQSLAEFNLLKSKAQEKIEQINKIIVFETNIAQINRYDKVINEFKIINIE